MPIATAKITYAVSWVSRTTVRKRTIDSAPTRLNARATLSPITCVTMAIRMVSSTSVTPNDSASPLRPRARRYTQAMASPSTRASTRRTNINTSAPVLKSIRGASASGMGGGAVDRGGSGEGFGAERNHPQAVLRRALRFERKLFNQALENRRHVVSVFQLEDHAICGDGCPRLPGESRLPRRKHADVFVECQSRRPLGGPCEPRHTRVGELADRADLA